MLLMKNYKRLFSTMVLVGVLMSYHVQAQDSAVGTGEEIDTLPEMSMTPPDMAVSAPFSEYDDPCPKPLAGNGKTPDDLAAIQADITRFNLCVERAQLLQRLNELAAENMDTISVAISDVVADDVERAVEEKMIDMMPQITAVSQANTSGMSDVQPPSIAPSMIWSIQNIHGQNNKLQAVLVDDTGRKISVSEGDTLDEGSAKVTQITNTAVKVKTDNETVNLMWVQ